MGFSAYSIRNDIHTAIRPGGFRYLTDRVA
jgi:hypothetical protein